VTAPDAELRLVWQHAVGRGHDEAFERLLGHHREPHRRYHTATHVLWVCRHVAALAANHPVDDLAVVEAAALFHDAVYDPRSTTNERDSARLATHTLRDVGWTDVRTDEVARLIELTAAHVSPGDDDVSAAVLLDADLAILGAEPSAYAAYVTGVRAEYAHVGDEAWRTGRAQVLNHFLGQPAIYATATMRAERDARARANLTAELAALEESD